MPGSVCVTAGVLLVVCADHDGLTRAQAWRSGRLSTLSPWSGGFCLPMKLIVDYRAS